MPYQFRNLVFEGGGVKGIAYVGALKVLENKGVLKGITRVGGTSAGAINAAMLAFNYTLAETRQIMQSLDFKQFKDDNIGLVRDTERLLTDFGWFKGDVFKEWMSGIIGDKCKKPHITFGEMKTMGKFKDLYVVGTNLSTGFSEIFSHEHTPNVRVADAVRISMSIPLFFASVRGVGGDVYVDGGVIDNYPVKLFDREKYLSNSANGVKKDYYKTANKTASGNAYVYNKETLGFKLDSKEEIATFQDGKKPPSRPIGHMLDYILALVDTVMDIQASQHLHTDDWHRTIYIDTLGVKTTDFGLTKTKKEALVASGTQYTTDYFSWFDAPTSAPLNK